MKKASHRARLSDVQVPHAGWVEAQGNTIMIEADTIIKLWNDGLTATQIGERFGTTRSSILGKISRLRAKGALIERRAAPTQAKIGRGSGKPRKALQRKEPPDQLRFEIFFAPTPPIAEIEPEPVEMLFSGTGVDLFTLKRTQCHYIIGREDDTHMYCGAPSFRRSMCREHHARCYYTPKT